MRSMFVNLISNLKNHQRSLGISIIAVVSLAIIGSTAIKIYRSPYPLRLIVANLGSRSASIVFMTYEPTDTCIYVYQQKQLFRGKFVCDQNATTHLLTVEELQPEENYRFIIKSGWRIAQKSTATFTTTKTPENAPSLPISAFGKVVTVDQSPAKDALVVVFPDKDSAKAIVTKTNAQGNFALDLSSMGESIKTLTVDVSTADGLWGNSQFPAEIRTPFNDIVVSPIITPNQ